MEQYKFCPNDQWPVTPIEIDGVIGYRAELAIYDESVENINSENPSGPIIRKIVIPADRVSWLFHEPNTVDHCVQAKLDMNWFAETYPCQASDVVEITMHFAEGSPLTTAFDRQTSDYVDNEIDARSQRVIDRITKEITQKGKNKNRIDAWHDYQLSVDQNHHRLATFLGGWEAAAKVIRTIAGLGVEDDTQS